MELYLQHKLVWLAEFAGILSVLLVPFDLLGVRSVQQELLDVGLLQSVRGHVHEHLTELLGRQLQVGYQDGWTTRKKLAFKCCVGDIRITIMNKDKCVRFILTCIVGFLM